MLEDGHCLREQALGFVLPLAHGKMPFPGYQSGKHYEHGRRRRRDHD